jgi:hypothetical protein
MNCILAAYHIPEWVWARWLKPVSPVHLRGTVIRHKRDFVKWLAAHAPEFELIQDLANGAKHCFPTHPTSEVRGWGRGPYGVGPWGAAYLLIDLGEERGTEARYRAALEVLRNVVEFWDDFFADQAIPRPGSP